MSEVAGGAELRPVNMVNAEIRCLGLTGTPTNLKALKARKRCVHHLAWHKYKLRPQQY